MQRYPLAIRTVAEVTGAHGSTVTAAVNAASMSLLNAGVPVLSHISAVSMGVLLPVAGEESYGTEEKPVDGGGNCRVLVDTTADEEECVDMIVHVAGNKVGRQRLNKYHVRCTVYMAPIDPKGIAYVLGPE